MSNLYLKDLTSNWFSVDVLVDGHRGQFVQAHLKPQGKGKSLRYDVTLRFVKGEKRNNLSYQAWVDISESIVVISINGNPSAQHFSFIQKGFEAMFRYKNVIPLGTKLEFR